MMQIKTIQVGALEENCYMIFDDAEKALYIIDPGDEAERLIAEAKKFDFRKCCIMLTHGHIDHISAVNETAAALNVEYVLASEDEMELIKSPYNQIMPMLPALKTFPEFIHKTPISAPFEMIPAPGHSRGGVCYYFKDIPAMFVGDTIFASSVGRTDLPGGDWEELLNSIRTGILTKDNELKLYPGHGSATTVGAERSGNPYLQ